MLIKELVESEQITGAKATWALAAVGYYAKTPTRELLHELVVCLSKICTIIFMIDVFNSLFIIEEPVEIERRAVFQDRIADHFDDRCRFVEHGLQLSFLCRQALPRRRFGRLLRQQGRRHH